MRQWMLETMDAVHNHDLDWVVNVLDGNAEVFTEQEGADMDARLASSVGTEKQRRAQGWG